MPKLAPSQDRNSLIDQLQLPASTTSFSFCFLYYDVRFGVLAAEMSVV